MAIRVTDNIDYKGLNPDFVRQQYATLADMVAVRDNTMPQMYLAYCLETRKVYLYDKTNSVSAETGKFREYAPSGSGDCLRFKGTISTINELPSLETTEVGWIYNVINPGKTTSEFVEGAGISFPAGANIAVVNVSSSGIPELMYDLLGGEVNLAPYATKRSPNFTGVPTAPTPDVSSNNTQIATTEFVKNCVAGISGVFVFRGTIETVENLPQLSTVDVGDVYNISQAGTSTIDFIEGAGKEILAGGNVAVVGIPVISYEEVTATGEENPSEEGWYELVDDNYELSSDTEVDPNKTYYERTTSLIKKWDILAGTFDASKIEDELEKKITMCDELPAEPEVGDIRLYLGGNTSEHKQGHIYRFQHSEKHLYAWRVRVGRVYDTVYSETPIPEVGYQMLWEDGSQTNYIVAYYDSENQELGLNQSEPGPGPKMMSVATKSDTRRLADSGDSPIADDEEPPHADYYGTRDSESDIDEDKSWWEDISQEIKTQKHQTMSSNDETIRLRVPYPFNGTVLQVAVVPPASSGYVTVLFNVVVSSEGPRVYAFPDQDFAHLVSNFAFTFVDEEYIDLTFWVPTFYSGGSEDTEEIESTIVYVTQIGGPQVYYELSTTRSRAETSFSPESLLSNDLPTSLTIDESTYNELDQALSALCTAVSARLRFSGITNPNNYLPSAASHRNQVYRTTADFTTTSDFRVQGIELKAGSAIYSDGQYWNVFSAVPPITVDSSMSDSSTNPVQNNTIKAYVDDAETSAVQTAGQNAASAISTAIQALDAVVVGGSGKYIKQISETNGVISATEGTLETDVNPIVSAAINNLDVNKIGGSGKLISSVTEANGKISATTVDIDSSMSDSSTNPVQNNTVKSYVDSEVSSRVEKETGKGLSSNDFTTALKDKLDNIESNAQVNVQSDWSESDSSSDSFIKNKPTIPPAQVNADWNSSSGVSEILNKPNLAPVATSGDYTDLSNTPAVDTAMSESSTNAVQNKVVKSAIDTAEQAAKDYCDQQIASSITAVLNTEF